MAQHKYLARQIVRYAPEGSIDADARGDYAIVRALPETGGGVPQYRVKAKIDGRERVVREDQLAPSEMAAEKA